MVAGLRLLFLLKQVPVIKPVIKPITKIVFFLIFIMGSTILPQVVSSPNAAKTNQPPAITNGKKPLNQLRNSMAAYSTRSWLPTKWLRDRVKASLGFAVTSDYFKKEEVLSLLGGGIGYGAIAQELRAFNAKESAIRLTNPTQAQGGCPDVPGVPLSNPIKLDTMTIPAQIFTIQGTGCAYAGGEGNALTLLGADVALYLSYSVFSNLFWVRSGVKRSIVIPNAYTARIRYTGETKDIAVSGLKDPQTNNPILSIGADILIDSTAYTRHSGFIYEVPFMIGMNVIYNERGTMYFGMGAALNIASYTINTKGSMNSTIIADGKKIDMSGEAFEDVINTTNAMASSLIFAIGGEYRFYNRMAFFVEFNWSKGGAAAHKSGTTAEPGKKYASDVLAANVLDQVSPKGAIAKVLQTKTNPNGARTLDGIQYGYQLRWLVGINYVL